MLNQIRKSSSFQNDLKKYNSILEKLPEGQNKLEFQKLVSNLIQEVKKMDDLHLELIYNKQMPSLGTERRETIMSVRKQLEQKIKEYKLD
jgi:hypothetical protein